MKHIFKALRPSMLTLCFLGICASLIWLLELTPRAYDIEIINPDLSTRNPSDSTLVQRDFSPGYDGLFWIKFTTKPQLWPLKRLNLRTFSCVKNLTINQTEWNLPQENGESCDNREGITILHTEKALSQSSTWHLAGVTDGQSFGVLLQKDWREVPVLLGLSALLLFIILALSRTLPASTLMERGFAILLLMSAFMLRFWLVFLESPPELSLFSDMGGYFSRAEEISQGFFNSQQLFQPVGFTLWSLWLRKLGGFELLNWSQVFLSWGTVLLIYLIVRNRFGKLPALIALTIAAVHIPLAGFATFHMAETAYAFLITLFLWFLLKTFQREHSLQYLFLGLLLAIAFYFKGNHTFFIPLFAGWIFYRERHKMMIAMRKVLFLGLGGALVLIPHLVWTAQHYGRPHVGPTAGALNFVEGKCPSKDNADSTGARWMSPLFNFTNERTFKQWDRPFTDQAYFWKEGLKCVQQNPGVLLTSFRYIYYLAWGNELWPLISTPIRDWYKPWTHFFYYAFLPLSLLGFLIHMKERESFAQVCLLLLLSLFFTVWFFKSENRFRVPFDALFISWAAVGAAWLRQRIRIPQVDSEPIHDPQVD